MSKPKSTPNSPTPATDPMGIQRGDYSRTLSLPKLMLIALRLLSPFTQHLILKSHSLSIFAIPPPPTGGTFTTPSLPSIPLLSSSLTIPQLTLPIFPTLMTLMPTTLALSHTYWLTTLARESMTLPFAIFGGLADLIYESITTIVFTSASVNPMFSPRLVYTGSALYFSAILVEKIAERQRDAFKDDPLNKGRICDVGRWGWVRHPNYTANIVFGFGYGLAAGGIGYALATGGMYASNLSLNAGPSLEEHMAKRYGEQWDEYTRRVRWRLFPGIF